MGPGVTEPLASPADASPEPAAEPTRAAPPKGLTMFELAKLEEARRQAAQLDSRVRDSASTARAMRQPSRLMAAGATLVACSIGIGLYGPLKAAVRGAQPLHRVVSEGAEVLPEVSTMNLARPAFGKSGNVHVRVAMPGQLIEFPVLLAGDASGLAYQWVRAADSTVAESPRPLGGTTVVTPRQPGLYHLALSTRDPRAHAAIEPRRVLGDVTVAVLVPFGQKLGGMINGYRIGAYPFERLGGERPLGFIEVDSRTADLRISRHLRLADFITHDRQGHWPKYLAVSPRLLDKVELVVNEVARMNLRGISDPLRISVDVHSGFRTPLHNRGVEGAALASRHQYGDAIDVAIDADGDGRFSSFDSRLVAIAVEMVEKRHPELTGGLGVYVNSRSPYVHIDARGRRARWWG